MARLRTLKTAKAAAVLVLLSMALLCCCCSRPAVAARAQTHVASAARARASASLSASSAAFAPATPAFSGIGTTSTGDVRRSQSSRSSTVSSFAHYNRIHASDITAMKLQSRTNAFPTTLTSRRRQTRSLYIQPRRRHLTKEEMVGTSSSETHHLLMAACDDDDASLLSSDTKTLGSIWNLPGLRKETSRLHLRAIKKIGKASQRLQSAQQTAQQLLDDPNATMEQLEACPNVEVLEVELTELRERLAQLAELEEGLQTIKVGKKKEMVLPPDLATLALDLGVSDAPPQRAPRGPKKKKGPRANEVTPRKPYRRYFTTNQTEIRVGKQAEDNDQLSLLPEHRDGADWWMHASGCPGSHVVIRCHDADVDAEVVADAAALAARQSKCSGETIKVSMVRCREVSKPRGAKAGLVQLNGNVRTVVVKMSEAKARLDRLDGTVLIN